MKGGKISIHRFLFLCLFCIGFSSIFAVGYLWISSEQSRLKKETSALRASYLGERKELLKREVDQVLAFVKSMQSQTEYRLRESVKGRVHEACAIAQNIYQTQKDDRSLHEIKTTIKEALRPIRFNKGRGYYFSFSLDGIETLFPEKPEMEGKSMLSVKGGKGELVVPDMLSIIEKNGEGFYRYTWPKPNQDGYYPKIAFIKLLEPIGWVLGTGEYLDDVEKDIQQECLKWISHIRFGKNGYVFAGQWDGISLSGPAAGRNVYGIEDKNGVKIVQELIRAARSGGGFVRYVFPDMEGKRHASKLSYAVGLPEWQWYIGAGVYIDDIEAAIKEKEKEIQARIGSNLRNTMIIIAALIVVIFLTVIIVSNRIRHNLLSFKQFFHLAASDVAQIDHREFIFSEFSQLAESANDMVDKLWCAEKALRVSEEKYRRIFENSVVGFFQSTPKGQFINVNSAFAKMLKYDSPDDLIKNISDIAVQYYVDPQDRLRYQQILKRMGKVDGFEFKARCRDGSELWVSNSTRAYFDENGDVVHYEGVIIDITERKRAEAALEKRILALTQPLDDIAESISFHDLFNLKDIQQIQDEFASATGVASIITQTDGTPITQPSNFCRLCSEIIRKTDQGRLNCYRSDAEIGRYHPEGPIIQPCISGGLWDAGAGITVGGMHIANWLIGQVRDNTQSEERIREYAKEIGADENLVVEAFREVPAMSREKFGKVAQALFTLASQLSNVAYNNVQQARLISRLKTSEKEQKKLQSQLIQAQKMESVGRLAGGIAHDFNNMLSIILGNTEMILEEIDPVNPQISKLREIQKAADRSTDLTRQLLAFARKQTVAPMVLNLNRTLEGMLKMLQRLIGEDIILAWLPATDLWHIKMDPSQIDQVLANLCVNARDSIKGGGNLIIETSNAALDQDYCSRHAGFKPGEYVMIAVSDDGCGMNKETLDHVFEPFFTTKDAGRGTGLGLATVYGIVKQNNGFINVYSEPGKGTTFRIYLPRETADGVKSRELEYKKTSGKGSETILLVEDEKVILNMTAMMLKRLGYTVLSASDPNQAVRIGSSYQDRIDMLMTDVVMPGMNGRELAQKMLQMYPDIKCLFMSGYTANVIAHHGVLEDGVNFINKPFTSKDLASKVRKTLDG